MRSLKSFIFIAALTLAAAPLCTGPVSAQGDVTAGTGYRKVRHPDSYGTVVMDRNTKGKDMRPVLFPHWAHRARYSCKACHTDIGFPMKAGETDIKQADIEAGKHCGKCHNGAVSFPASECDRCHSQGIMVEKNARIDVALKGLPADDFGNKVNWAAALKEGKTNPSASPDGKGELTPVDLDIVIPVTKFKPSPPDVLFPHKPHTRELDCASCHEGIFKQKKGGNPEMNMMKIMAGQYCGVCHGRVAFPQEDCYRCHSRPVKKPEEEKKKD